MRWPLALVLVAACTPAQLPLLEVPPAPVSPPRPSRPRWRRRRRGERRVGRAQRAALVAGAWLRRPSNYVTVGLTGKVANGVYEGRIDNPTCGAFHVRLAPDDDEVDY